MSVGLEYQVEESLQSFLIIFISRKGKELSVSSRGNLAFYLDKIATFDWPSDIDSLKCA